MTNVIFGLEHLISDKKYQDLLKGRVGVLCHSASVDKDLKHTLVHLKGLLGDRLTKIFGPQHGFVCDVQDNMVETEDFIHPYFNIIVHSLYGETRRPTADMISELDTVVIDLQDVGTRVYTYITTMSYMMEECAKAGIRVVVLDRPNPVGGELIEGPVLQEDHQSFVGHHPIPQRHGLTLGEVARLQNDLQENSCDLHVVPLKAWNRSLFWKDINRKWVNPSPNLPTQESANIFCGSVLFEGCNVSEGRGTTRSLEILGAPGLEPFAFCDHLNRLNKKEWELDGFTLRPHYFHPMFQKHAGKPCGGVHIHPTDPEHFLSWRLGALLMREFYQQDIGFKWNDQPYEYETRSLAIDYINGSDSLRLWVENNGSVEDLISLEQDDLDPYYDLRDNCLLY